MSDTPVSYSLDGAAACVGLSVATIRRAVDAGDLAVRYPTIGGRVSRKPVIERVELEEWIRAGRGERA